VDKLPGICVCGVAVDPQPRLALAGGGQVGVWGW